jgi:hypothetical protein
MHHRSHLPSKTSVDQRTLNSRKVGREDEGVSSSRLELVALAECLEDHGDDVSLLYLTDSEANLQAIKKSSPSVTGVSRRRRPDSANQSTETFLMMCRSTSALLL